MIELSERQSTSKTETPKEKKTPEEDEFDTYVGMIKLKVMKLPKKSRDELMDKFIKMSSDAVTAMDTSPCAPQMPTQYPCQSSQSAQQMYTITRNVPTSSSQSLYQQQLQFTPGQIQQHLLGLDGVAVRQAGLSTIDEETVACIARSLPNYNTTEISVPVSTPVSASSSSANNAAAANADAGAAGKMTYAIVTTTE